MCSLVKLNIRLNALGQNILEGGEWIERIAYWLVRRESTEIKGTVFNEERVQVNAFLFSECVLTLMPFSLLLN